MSVIARDYDCLQSFFSSFPSPSTFHLKFAQPRNVLALLLCSVLSACSSSSLFSPYPNQVNPVLNDLRSGVNPQASSLFNSKLGGKDDVLYLSERGRIAQISHQFDQSISDFSKASDIYKEKDRAAVIKASKAGSEILAVSINDNVIPYKGEAFERIMLHNLQALNYVFKKDIENAAPEARIAADLQREAMKSHQDEIASIKKEAENNSIDYAIGNKVLKSDYAQIDEVAGKVKNAFQNAYAFYLGALIFEAHKEPTYAYKDIQNALELVPTNRSLQRHAIRLAKRLNLTKDQADYKKRFPETAKETNKNQSTSGQLVVIYEDEFIPQKREIKVALPIDWKGGVITAAFPSYEMKWTPASPLAVLDAGKLLGTTETLIHLNALAANAMRSRIPEIAVRQVLRTTVKQGAVMLGAAAAARKNEALGDLVNIVGSMVNYITENADLRGWYSLPNNVQVLEMTLPIGDHALELRNIGDLKEKVTASIEPGKTTIIHAIKTGYRLHLYQVTI